MYNVCIMYVCIYIIKQKLIIQKFFFNGAVVASENFLQDNSVSLVMFLGHKCRVSCAMASTEKFA